MSESIYLTFDIVFHLRQSGTCRKIKSNKLQSDIENSFANDTQTSQEFIVVCSATVYTLFKVWLHIVSVSMQCEICLLYIAIRVGYFSRRGRVKWVGFAFLFNNVVLR